VFILFELWLQIKDDALTNNSVDDCHWILWFYPNVGYVFFSKWM